MEKMVEEEEIKLTEEQKERNEISDSEREQGPEQRGCMVKNRTKVYFESTTVTVPSASNLTAQGSQLQG
ncbi:hypothetical protein llap_15331 [Limosa lapponica baueri]|uniref:Uncharacterized protein n=1 Tax=Limosa lapponica baueri TaxID=1758121 RepID=A0A2I0TKS1_LIMLA|nr:hypothetical protein llap_15331 [Limosa lapponica baueri]